MKDLQLSEAQLLVLQQVSEMGEEEVGMLASELRLARPQILKIIQDLHRKGLVRISQNAWIALSNKGRQLVQAMWPQMTPYAI